MAATSLVLGPLEKAIRQRHPEQAVQYEAGALDRELASAEPHWNLLLQGIDNFCRHYPAVLLESTDAIEALGRGCLAAVERAPTAAVETRGAEALVDLLDAILAEVPRLGVDRVDPAVAPTLKGLLDGLGELRDPGQVVEGLLSCGKRCLLVADEGRPPQPWFDLLDSLTRLLLANTQVRVAGEPSYDGRWSDEELQRDLRPELLEPVCEERLARDRLWLQGLGKALEASSGEGAEANARAVDIFLQLAEYDHRSERAEAWSRWFAAVAESAQGSFSARSLRHLSRILAEWIASTRDLRFLRVLASELLMALPTVLSRLGPEGLAPGLHPWAEALVKRLQGEGMADPAFRDLRAAARELARGRLESKDAELHRAGLELGLQLSLGPLVGQALDLEQALWLLRQAAEDPEAAGPCLAAMVVPFATEHCELFGQAGDAARFAQGLCALLDAELPRALEHGLRALIRLAPFSPLQLAGASVQRCLLALSPDERGMAYLEDLRQRILSRPGRESLRDVERVLAFWRCGHVSALDGLASAESLAALAAAGKRHEQLRRLVERLAELSPGARVCGEDEVGWLAGLPETYYQPETLTKLAGFEGLDPRAVEQLHQLLCVYRLLEEKFGGTDHREDLSALGDGDLLGLVDRMLERRRELSRQLRATPSGEVSGDAAFVRLEPWGEELETLRRVEGIFEELAVRELMRPEACSESPEGPERLLWRMLQHAALSGVDLLDESGLESLQSGCLHGQDLRQLLSRLSSALKRNREVGRLWLRPAVKDSLRRLWSNPLSRPSESFARWCSAWRDRPESVAVNELTELLADDLAASDGGLLLLEDFVQRMAQSVA